MLAPWAITPLLMLGRDFLGYEGGKAVGALDELDRPRVPDEGRKAEARAQLAEDLTTARALLTG